MSPGARPAIAKHGSRSLIDPDATRWLSSGRENHTIAPRIGSPASSTMRPQSTVPIASPAADSFAVGFAGVDEGSVDAAGAGVTLPGAALPAPGAGCAAARDGNADGGDALMGTGSAAPTTITASTAIAMPCSTA